MLRTLLKLAQLQRRYDLAHAVMQKRAALPNFLRSLLTRTPPPAPVSSNLGKYIALGGLGGLGAGVGLGHALGHDVLGSGLTLGDKALDASLSAGNRAFDSGARLTRRVKRDVADLFSRAFSGSAASTTETPKSDTSSKSTSSTSSGTKSDTSSKSTSKDKGNTGNFSGSLPNKKSLTGLPSGVSPEDMYPFMGLSHRYPAEALISGVSPENMSKYDINKILNSPLTRDIHKNLGF